MIKETIIPAGANKGVFLLAPMLTFALALIGLGGDPVRPKAGDRRHQCRHPLPLRDLVARGLRHHHRRLGVELEIRLPGRAALGAQMVSYEVSIGFVIVTVLLCVGSLNLNDIVKAQEPSACGSLASRCSRCSWSSTSRPGRDQPPAVRPARSGIELVAGYLVEYSSMTFALFFLGEYANMILMSAMTTILFLGGWLRRSISRRSLGAGPDLVRAEDAFLPVRLPVGARHLPALPLRPADAPGLEGVPADLAGLGGDPRPAVLLKDRRPAKGRVQLREPAGSGWALTRSHPPAVPACRAGQGAWPDLEATSSSRR
jgi:hypothetical protein